MSKRLAENPICTRMTQAQVERIERNEWYHSIELPDGKIIPGVIPIEALKRRFAALGVPAVQIVTNGTCHLEARMLEDALARVPLDEVDLLFVENVGNLVCPASFELGEHVRVALTSTPEGDDKALKYPAMFRKADALVINKLDLLPHVSFDLDVCDPAKWAGHIHCSTDERAALTNVLEFPLVDLFRKHHPAGRVYSWWDYRGVSFFKDQGLRIDYIFATKPMAERCTACTIDRSARKGQDASDHAPVIATFS